MRSKLLAMIILGCSMQINAEELGKSQTVLPDGRKAIEYIQAGDTTFEKENRTDAVREKDFLFRGLIVDVLSGIDLRVNLGAGLNNIQVILEEKDGVALPTFRKNQTITFKGQLNAAGGRYKRPYIDAVSILGK